jgi:hypothetical protein
MELVAKDTDNLGSDGVVYEIDSLFLAALAQSAPRVAQGASGVLQSVSIIRRIAKTRTKSVEHVGQR